MSDMADADTLFRDGDLDGARAALVEIVKSQPSDQQARMFLFQLLALAGEWDKAKNQLQTLAKLSPEAQMLAVTYEQAMAAEQQRAEVFAGAREMPVLAGQDGWAVTLARSLTLLAQGDFNGAQAARSEAFDAAPDTPGELDGQRFEWVADADIRFGPTFEAIIHGRYGLIGFDQIASITSTGPRDLRDTVWYPVQIAFRKGQSIAALLPARYPGSETGGNAAQRLGRATAWVDFGAGEVGCGQHLWSLSAGEEHGLLDLRCVVFD